MKKIMLLSDTHGYMDDRILSYAEAVDEIWHAGDIGSLKVADALAAVKPVKGVFGNVDAAEIRKEFPEHQRFFCEGVEVWITHIGGYPGRYDKNIKAVITSNPPKLFICGHSHIVKVMRDKKLHLLHMNPGAAGKHGFHQVRTMLRFVIDGDMVKDLELIELENRK